MEPVVFITENSKTFYDRACQTLATGVSTIFRRHATPVPLYFERGDGPYYYDVDGHELLDYSLAWGPLILGSNHPQLSRAVHEQIDKAYTFGFQHEDEITLAELMRDVIPGVERVIFSNTGSEAVQAALRLARAYTGRDKIIKFEGHYHGWFNNILISCHPALEDLGQVKATCGGQPANEFADTSVVPWNDIDALKKAFADNPDQIAAVITEPVLANSGSCMPRDGYLQQIVSLCKQNDAVSIFDEVITGFRIAPGGAREYFNVIPDLSVYAKAMAGGFSMSAVGGRKEIFEVLNDGRTIHAGTYNGNCIAIAAAIATIETLRQPGVHEQMFKHGIAIRQEIEKQAAACNIPVATTGVGSVFSVHFGVDTPPLNYADTLKTDMETYSRFQTAMFENNIQILPDCRWYIGAVHTDKELAKVIPAIEASFKAL
jgi:glutamate-1-semialdehyde 2,1-aminomutase